MCLLEQTAYLIQLIIGIYSICKYLTTIAIVATYRVAGEALSLKTSLYKNLIIIFTINDGSRFKVYSAFHYLAPGIFIYS